MAKADVWMPLFIGDYLADTSRITTEQHGAYLLLMMDYWRNGPPPDNDQVLSQITRLSLDAWGIARAQIKQFFSIDDGVWRHKRIDEELVSARENKGKAQAKAKAAADARWNKGEKDASSNAPSIPQAMQEECPSPSPSPLPLKATSNTKAKAAPKARKPTKVPLPTDFALSDSMLAWAAKHGHVNLQAHFDSFVRKARANGYMYVDWDQALQNAIVDDWAKLRAPQARAGPPGYQTPNEKAKAFADRLTGKTRRESTFEFIDLNEPPP